MHGKDLVYFAEHREAPEAPEPQSCTSSFCFKACTPCTQARKAELASDPKLSLTKTPNPEALKSCIQSLNPESPGSKALDPTDRRNKKLQIVTRKVNAQGKKTVVAWQAFSDLLRPEP